MNRLAKSSEERGNTAVITAPAWTSGRARGQMGGMGFMGGPVSIILPVHCKLKDQTHTVHEQSKRPKKYNLLYLQLPKELEVHTS